jgi:hypothetical protein
MPLGRTPEAGCRMPPAGYSVTVQRSAYRATPLILGAWLLAGCLEPGHAPDAGPLEPVGNSDGGTQLDAGHAASDAAAPDAGLPDSGADAAIDAASPCPGAELSDPLDAGDAAYQGPVFSEVAAAAGLDHVQGLHWTDPDYPFGLQYPGPLQSGGVAVGDYDGDGSPDLYVTTLAGPDVLYRNQGDGTFANVTDAVGLGGARNSSGAAWGDVDGDADLDLYVTVMQGTHNWLFVQQGDGTFVEEALARGADLEGPFEHQAYSASFGDYDADGYPDLHLTEWYPYPLQPSMTRLLHNRGAAQPGYFDDATDAAGVSMEEVHPDGTYAFTSSFADMDDDGRPDLLIAADLGSSRLFWNAGDGTFVDGTQAAAVGTDDTGMGSAIGDYDGDGRLDWFVSAIQCPAPVSLDWPCPADGNRLYRNLGGRRFADCTDAAGVRDADWAWSSSFFDFDNDGAQDLVVTNGYASDARFAQDRTRLWQNRGDGRFRERGVQAGVAAPGADGRGLAVLDYDADGDLDLFVVRFANTPLLFRNDGPVGGYLRLRLKGRAPNTQALGARVTLEAAEGGAAQVRELRAGSNFVGQNESVLHFGLGAGAGAVSRVVIRWPDATQQVLTDVARDQVLEVAQ